MNLPANLPDASSLAATVERARALLDEGDVIAAKVLAAHAYDDAKSAARLAERFKAGEGLVRKAHRLQGDALLIESRAKMILADQWDAAKEAGLVPAGRPKSVAKGNAFTAEEIGMDRKEIHEARKLRDAEANEPGIVERAIAARLEAGLNPSRIAVVRGIGTRSASKDERGLDFYPTPAEAIHALLTMERFSPLVWEPACGNGAISAPLEAAGYDVFNSDIADRGCVDRHGELQGVMDFLSTKSGAAPGASCPDIVTNPPFGIINEFIAHALREHRPARMALLLNLNAMCGADNKDRLFWMEECPPARIWVFSRRLPMMHRDGWDGARSGSQMNTAWFVWEPGFAGTKTWDRLDWRKQALLPVLPPAAPPAAKPKRVRKVKADA